MKFVCALLLGVASYVSAEEYEDTTAQPLYDGCTTDQDCQHNEICNSDGACEGDSYACYDDDECRGKQVCDMSQYICVDPTPSPTEPEPVGCCGSDSSRSFDMCNAKETRDKCTRSSSCTWVEGEDAVCEPPSTTIDPGCCYGNPDSAYSSRWMTACTGYDTERECLFNEDEDGNKRCHWEDLIEGYDCSMLWPTTTETPTEPAGCCYGGSYKSNDKCTKATSQDKCESKDCFWLVTDDPEDCIMTTTETPTTTVKPGCCYGDSYKANDKCAKAMDEAKCESKGCNWLETDDPEDCIMTTTSSPTTTEEA